MSRTFSENGFLDHRVHSMNIYSVTLLTVNFDHQKCFSCWAR